MAAPALTPEQQKAWLQENVNADLTYIFEQMGVSLERQYELGQHYKSVMLFAALADNRGEARTALARDLGIDPAANPANRASLAAVVAAWQQAADAAEKERTTKAEARSLGLPKPLLQTERHAMRVAIEKVVGPLDEKEEPSADYLAQKLEEVEAGDLLASSLDDISSVKEDSTSQLQSNLDATGRIRITREKKKSKLPASSEELRSKLRVEAHAMLMLAARFKNKVWFQELSMNTYQRYVDYLLGDKVYQLQISKGDGSAQTTWANPSWDLMLSFEHRLRKEAYRKASREGLPLSTTLKLVMEDASIKETHFVTPLTLEFARRGTSASSGAPPGGYDKWKGGNPGATRRPTPKGGQKGGGKGKSRKGKLGANSNAGFVYSTTPDGRQICYAFNNSTCNGQCNRADVKDYLAALAKKDGVTLYGLQVDILRNEGHDLLKEDTWAWVLEQLDSGIVDLLVAAPPCNTHSRARCQYQIRGGPRPLRDHNFPRGFPWLSGKDRNKVALADELIDKSFDACKRDLQHGGHFLLEHPEQLGVTMGQIPASIWDLPETSQLLQDKRVRTFAFFQCAFEAISAKPTRFLTTLGDDVTGYSGLHILDEDGRYQGPLPPHCMHGSKAHPPLVGKDDQGQWKTQPSATYPPNMCSWIATLAWAALLRSGGGKGQPKSSQETKRDNNPSTSNPSTSTLSGETLDREGEPFHGHLKGALLEHKGMPLTCNWHAKKPSSFNDGCGLCSPGRWPPKRRNFQQGAVKEFIEGLAKLIQEFTKEVIPDAQRMFFALSLGKLERAPFSEGKMSELRSRWFQMLPSPAEASKLPEGQPFYLHALAQTARKMGDEDADILDSGEDNYVEGRWVGYKHVFPRAEARRRYGEKLRIAALGAIPKDDGRVRVIFDATHFVQMNNHIVIQDKLEFPGPEASATLMDTTLAEGFRLMIAVAADIALAHRRFKHRPEDVGLLGCRVEPDGPVWFNKVGTFGVACAAYHFARLASLVGRLVMRLAGQAHVFQLLFADDLKMVAAGPDKYERVWHMLIAWIMFGAPFRWPKFRGGVCLEFVGFFMDYCKFEVGLSERRTNWIVQWIKEAQANRGVVAHRSFVELVGRLVYASQVLTWLRGFMAPLHSWKAAIAPGTVATMPRTVSVVLLFISSMLQSGFHRTSGKSPIKREGQAFRTDAKCEEGRIVLGGWEVGKTSDPKKSRWFALEISPKEASWLFEKEKVESMSTTAELLASLVALEVFGFFEGKAAPAKVLVEAGTDNLATEHVSLKEASNKFPLAYVQAQLSLKCFLHGIVFRLEWRPRDTNVEADALTNLQFGSFDSALRCQVRWADLKLPTGGGGMSKRLKQLTKSKW
eukprot:s5210_g2.t1